MEDKTFKEVEALEPEAVIRWIASVSSGAIVPADDFNWLLLASVLGSRMYAESNTNRMSLWGRAAISVYDLLAERDESYHADISAMETRAFMIKKRGTKSGDELLDVDLLMNWFLSYTSYLPDEARVASERFWPQVRKQGLVSPTDYQQLLHIRGIKHRLRVLKYLKDEGVEIRDERFERWLDVFETLI